MQAPVTVRAPFTALTQDQRLTRAKQEARAIATAARIAALGYAA